ncbi:unnamed protein product, partial [Rhizoctonia solani]
MPDSLPPAKGNPPKGEPNPWTLEDLKRHCETAVKLEMHTIPIYLYPMYAINTDPGTLEAKKIANDASNKIKGVVEQEMLHLGLAGNILCSIGGNPKIYGLEHTPEFPCQIFYDPIDLHLMPPNNDAIETFVRLEAPHQRPDLPRGNIMPGYDSIGEFYESLERGIKFMDEKMKKEGKTLFDPQYNDRQFTPDDGAYPDGMIQIKNLNDALEAMKLIVEQGEGSTVTEHAAPGEESHWQIFESLVNANIPHYDVVQDPKTGDPAFNENIKKCMRASDAVYNYLLWSIQCVWTETSHRDDLLSNISSMMRGIIRPIAQFLVKQKVNGAEDSKHAAPTFNYYQFGSIESAKEDMIREL